VDPASSGKRIEPAKTPFLGSHPWAASSAGEWLAFIGKAKALGRKSPSLKFHQEALTAAQRTALRKLGPVMTQREFYLAGGTALPLSLGHRRSVDLGWFTEKPIEDPMRLAQEIRDGGIAFKTDSIERGTLYGTVSALRVSFLEYRYPVLRPLVPWGEFECLMASLDDIACMKLSAVAQRGSRKDFVDIYALGLEHISLKEMLRLYQKKFAVQDIAHVLYGLTFFDDAERTRMPRMLWAIDWKTIKKTIQAWVRETVNPPVA
jgi:hypothetical protein